MIRSSKFVLVLCPAIAATALSIGACGTPPAGGQSVQADTAFDRTGTLRSDGAYTSMTSNNYAISGDEGNTNMAQRAFVSVVLNQVPAGATVTKATLRLKASAPEGDPFGEFGNLKVDHVNIVSSISAGSFAGNVLTADIAAITSLPAGLATQDVEIDITAAVVEDLAAGRPISSFRFQFANAPSNDGNFDQVFIKADQNDIAQRPTAEIVLSQ